MNLKKIILGAILSFTSFCLILILLTRYPILYGIDGPYYLIQLRHLVSEGVIKYPDPPLTYYMLLPFYLLSADPNFGIKVGVSFYAALTALMFYAVFGRAFKSDAAGLVAGALYTASPFAMRLAMDFIKNFIGIFFIALFLYAALSTRDYRAAVAAAAVSTIGSALSHVLDFGVLALIAVLLLVGWLIKRAESSKTVLYASLTALILSAVILASSLLIIPQLLGYDASKLIEFLKNPEARREPSLTLQRFDFFIPAIILAAGGLIYSLAMRPRNPKLTYAVFTTSILLIIMNFPLIGSSWLFRFRLMNAVLIPVLPAALVAEMRSRSSQILASVIILALTSAIALPTIPALRPSIPMKGYFELQQIPKHIPKGSTILVPDTALRYWVEALHEENYEIVAKLTEKPSTDLYIITRTMRKRPIPPRAIPVFRGEFIEIFKTGR